MPVTIQFKKELSIDLNKYYSSFSRGLREDIEAELLDLLGGAPKKPREARGGSLEGVDGLKVVKFPRKGVSKRLAERIEELSGGKWISLKDFLQYAQMILEELGKPSSPHDARKWVSNLLIAGYVARNP